MSKEEYRRYISEALEQIENLKFLNRILNYVMKYLARSGK